VSSKIRPRQSLGSESNETVNLKPFFEGHLDFSTLLPPSVGDKFWDQPLMDPTLSNLFPALTDARARKFFSDNELYSDNLWNGTQPMDSRLRSSDAWYGWYYEDLGNAPGHWWRSHWFGMHYLQSPMDLWDFEQRLFPTKWMNHLWLGWVYPAEATPASVWFWQDKAQRWLWTNRDIYPVLYSYEEAQWLYLDEGNGDIYNWKEDHWVKEDKAPTITLAGETEMNLGVGQDFEEPGYSAVDDEDGDLTSKVVVTGVVNVQVPGSYTLTYAATDAAGNTATAQRVVTVFAMITMGENFAALTDLEMIWVEPGTFAMGSPWSEPDRLSDETQHEVTLTKGYWLAKYELTQAQWKAVMGTDPSYFKGDSLPVEVWWEDAKAFCDKLQEQESAAGRVPAGYAYQLPTEAQWEYACRAGTTTATAFGNSLSSTQANFDGNYPYNGGAIGPYLGKTANVGSYAANAWGFHDMHGNVWEWCADWYGSYPTVSVTDPEGAVESTQVNEIRVVRGGGWLSYGLNCRSAYRDIDYGGYAMGLGFRPSLRVTDIGTYTDTTAPVVTLSGDAAMDWEVGKAFVEPGYSASDDVDGDLSLDVVVTGSVNVQVAGSYTLTYTATDAAGNSGTAERVVTVVAGNTSGEDITVLPGTPLQMIWVEPGTFMMGSPTSEPDREAAGTDETQHQVTLTKGYWLAKHELTQAQWKAVMGTDPSNFKGDNLPVEKVSWEDAKAFCDKLQEQESAAGRVPPGYAYQLPTEAQWEYACRAGTTTATAYGYSLSSNQANFNGDYPYNGGATGSYLGKTANVGSYAANAWGFHDMHGNVWEWCADWYGDYPTGSVNDPAGAGSGTNRVVRGGGWYNSGKYCRSALRSWNYPGLRHYFLGFRPSLRATDIGTYTDTTAPVVTLIGDAAMDWEVGKAFEEPGYSASDNVDGDLTSKVVVTGSVDVQVPGSYTLVYSATDAAGNTGTAQRVVTVVAGNTSDEDFTVLTDLQMIWVEPGTFTMGSPTSEPAHWYDETQHQVTLTMGYWLAKHELTQAQWKAVMGTDPSRFKGDNLPVEQVSWNDAKAFCEKLQEQESAAGRVPAGYAYQLPTEAQWEYACRAGTTTATAFGDSLSSTQANFDGRYPYNGGATGPYLVKTANVGSYAANAWGFHDMHGNVYEWCADWYGSYPTGSVADPEGAGPSPGRVYRGGSWCFDGLYCRSADRHRVIRENRPNYLGFRPSLRSE
jgi:formylglycine-generating enzyme required for sulfatase activity